MFRNPGTPLVVLGALFDLLAAGLLVLSLTGRNPGLALFAAVPGVIGAIFLAIGLALRARAARTGEGAKAGTAVGGFLADKAETRSVAGGDYEVHYQTPVSSKNNNRPSKLTVRVPCQTPTILSIREETGFNQICKSWGIARECDTGDAEFDALAYVRCSSIEYAESYCSDPAKRFAVLALRGLGFPEVRLTGTHAEAVWPGFRPDLSDRPGLADGAGVAIRALATELPEVDEPEAIRAAREPASWPLWALLVPWALTAVAFPIYPLIEPLPPMIVGAGLGLFGFLAFAWVSAWFLRGGSRSGDKWKALLIGAAFLVPLGSAGALALWNGALDGAAATPHRLPVVGKRTTRSKNSHTYYLEVPRWNGAVGTTELTVSRADFQAAQAGRSHLEVTTRPGALGYEWRAGKRLIP